MKKVSLSFLFTFLLLGILATSTFAAPTVVDPDPPGEEHNPEILPADGVGNLNPNANGISADAINQDENFDNVIKSVGMYGGDQKTHGQYKNNTNSCASCHQTHTSKADSLLFADSTFQTCSACHDGTLGFYNVFETGAAYLNGPSTAGTFGGSHANNMSVHAVDGSVAVKAAPGGNKNGTGTWAAEFNCASCHAPHGSYSDRLLHYNPNGMGQKTPAEGGLKADDVPVVDFANKGGAGSGLQGVRGTKAEHGLTDAAYDSIPADAVVIMIYENGKKTTNPWLYGYPVRGSSGNNHYYDSRLFTADPATILNANGTYPSSKADQVIDHYDYENGKGIISLKYDKGLVYGKTDEAKALLNAATFAEISRAYSVKLDLKAVAGAPSVVTEHNVSALWGSGGAGVQMSQFCSSCHTDYMKAGSNGGVTSSHGNYNGENYYGHTTTSSSYTCLRCHYAHGTDAEIMVDAQSRTVFDLQEEGMSAADALAYMKDPNPSSALKKFTGMSGCWACHNSSKATTLKNTNRDADHPDGMIDDPSTKTVTQPVKGTITFSPQVNFRSAPNMSASVITTIPVNTVVDIYDESDANFYYIKYNNDFGYVAKHAITKN